MSYRLILIDPQKLQPCSELESGLFIGARSLVLIDRPRVAAIVGDNGDFQWECTEFLADVASRSSSATGDTVRVYGEGLVAWMNFLTSGGLHLSTVAEGDFLAFRVYLRRRPEVGGSRLSPATVRLRMVAVLQFYRWTERRRVMASPLGKWIENEKDCGFSDFYSRRRRSTLAETYLPRVRTRLPVHVSDADLIQIIRALPLPYSLIVKWAATTGLRRFEICSMTVEQVSLAVSTGSREVLCQIEVTRKGGHRMPVYLPPALLNDTRWYMRLHRKNPSVLDREYVFIGADGRRISKESVTRRFRAAAASCGSNATFHHLRHKYALTVLQQLQRSAQLGSAINPLKAVQILLGHRNIETTSLYLDAVEMESESIEQALGFLYGSLPND